MKLCIIVRVGSFIFGLGVGIYWANWAIIQKFRR